MAAAGPPAGAVRVAARAGAGKQYAVPDTAGLAAGLKAVPRITVARPARNRDTVAAAGPPAGAVRVAARAGAGKQYAVPDTAGLKAVLRITVARPARNRDTVAAPGPPAGAVRVAARAGAGKQYAVPGTAGLAAGLKAVLRITVARPARNRDPRHPQAHEDGTIRHTVRTAARRRPD